MAELQTGEHALREFIGSGALRGGKMGRRWRVRRNDLSAYIETPTCPASSAATSGGTTSSSGAQSAVAWYTTTPSTIV
jgi:hypothetical protein